MIAALSVVAFAFTPRWQSFTFDAPIGQVSAGPGKVVAYGLFVEGAEFTVVDLELESATVFSPPSTDFRDSQLLQLPSPWGEVVGCNNVATNAVEVCQSGESILEGQRIWRTEDVNGDGYDDIYTESSVLYIHDGISWQEYNLPPLHDRPDTASIGDIDGDGKMELWTTEYTDTAFYGYFYQHSGMNLHIHRFGDDGYATEPTWTLGIDGIVYDALAVQLDDDPEREVLLAVTESVTDLGPTVLGGALVIADLTEPPTLEELPQGIRPFPRWPEHGWPDPLHAIGDINGDGIEEALIASQIIGNYDRPPETVYQLRIAGSSNDWDLLHPLVGFQVSFEDGGFRGHFATTTDLDEDGRLDIVSVHENPSGAPHPTGLDVWYAPWLEADAEPQHTGETADTGAPTPSTPTRDTGPTTSTTSSGPNPPATDEAGCGCTLRRGSPLLFKRLHRRRPQRGTP